MMTTCFLQASLVSSLPRFPVCIANRRHNDNLSPSSPVLIHYFDFHQFSSPNLNSVAYFTSSRRGYLIVSSNGINSTKSDANDLLLAEADPKVAVKRGASLAKLNNEKNFIQRFEQRDPTAKEANSTFIPSQKLKMDGFPLNSSNFVIMAALTVGVTVLLLDQKAMALGPEGPLMEEFWENMRRYALYALTVSSGVAYAVFQPLYELLRNPISAILIIAIGAGSFYLVSQVLSAMVGVSDFTYDYSY